MAERPKIGELLVAAGVIDTAALEAGLEKQRAQGGRLGKILVSMGALDEEMLVRTVARQLEMPVAWLRGKHVKAQVLAKVPGHLARKHHCLPVMFDRRAETLLLAMEDPSDSAALDEVAIAAGLPVRVVLAAPSELEEAIARHYPDARPPQPAASAAPVAEPEAAAEDEHEEAAEEEHEEAAEEEHEEAAEDEHEEAAEDEHEEAAEDEHEDAADDEQDEAAEQEQEEPISDGDPDSDLDPDDDEPELLLTDSLDASELAAPVQERDAAAQARAGDPADLGGDYDPSARVDDGPSFDLRGEAFDLGGGDEPSAEEPQAEPARERASGLDLGAPDEESPPPAESDADLGLDLPDRGPDPGLDARPRHGSAPYAGDSLDEAIHEVRGARYEPPPRVVSRSQPEDVGESLFPDDPLELTAAPALRPPIPAGAQELPRDAELRAVVELLIERGLLDAVELARRLLAARDAEP